VRDDEKTLSDLIFGARIMLRLLTDLPKRKLRLNRHENGTYKMLQDVSKKINI